MAKSACSDSSCLFLGACERQSDIDGRPMQSFWPVRQLTVKHSAST